MVNGLYAFFVALFVFAHSDAASCPFSKLPDLQCDCTGSSGSGKIFESATCQVQNQETLSKFDSAKSEFTITGDLRLEFLTPVKYVDNSSFVAFKSIGKLLVLSNNPVSVSWDSGAFESVLITNISFNNIYHFNSALKAVLLLQKDLQSLQVANAGAMHFGAGDLKDFQSLRVLSVESTGVSTIDEKAFEGLENHLIELSFIDIGLSTYPVKSFQKLIKLKRLDLSENGLNSFDLSQLNGINELDSFALDRNLLLTMALASVADEVPLQLRTITLTNSGVKNLDSSFSSILDRKEFSTLNIADNVHFICDNNLDWIAKYALCGPPRANIDNSKCANLGGKLLSDYLKEAVPNPCK